MDLFKKTNINKATSLDYNAKAVVHLKDRGRIGKLLNQYARRKLKQEISKE